MNEELILCTGGGTGGHVFPGLAVVEALSEIWDGEVGWIGSARGVERDIVEGAGLRYWAIPAGKLRRYISFANLLDAFRVLFGFFAALVLLIRRRPKALFSKGGFVTVPPVLAARVLRIPVFSHESDLDPGLATRINSRFSRRVFIPYEASRRYYPARLQDRLVVSGNPVRRRVLQGSASAGRRFAGFSGTRPIVLFGGGSQGAAQINGILAEILPELLERADVLHQRGPHDPPRGNEAHYASFSFLVDEFPHVLAAADLVVARAGAGTISELAATGTPAVLIPLMFGSSRGDQVRNAALYADIGAAVTLEGEDARAETVRDTVFALLDDPARRRRMEEAARAFGADRAADLIARTLMEAPGRR